MDRQDIINLFVEASKIPIFPLEKPLPDGFITDEYKSVVWNREQVEKSKEAYKIEREELRKRRSDAYSEAESRMLEYIQESGKCNVEQASVIYNAAYARGHACGYESVFDNIDEILDLIDSYQAAGKVNS